MKASALNKSGLNRLERRSIAALASVYGLRMFGLFLILPVLAIYAEQLQASPMLMGIALGVYGITQAIFQIPFGIMSDKFGRKPVILFGLGVFIFGSLVAAFSTTIEGVIVGRALQGAGAIAAAVLALTSDLTRENQRTKAMALIGMTIGLAFILALIASPWLEFFIGVQGLFIMTAILAVGSMLLIVKVVPTPVQSRNLEVKAVPRKMLELLKNPQLIRLDFGIFILHFVLTAMFVVVPIMMLERLGLETRDHWQVYIPALLGSIVFMVPMIILSGRKNLLLGVFLAAICILLLAQVLLMRSPSTLMALTLCMFFFFWGFNLLEAMLPSMVSRLAPAACKGSAMGVYNTFQFLGVFFGGFIGGVIYGNIGTSAVFVVCAVMLLIWVCLVCTAPKLRLLDSLVVNVNHAAGMDCQFMLEAVEGVEEVIIIEGESTAYLKVDNARLDQQALDKIIVW
ncbi:MAG: MFS family permease [Arenicella sp.]